ncbi:MAG: GAF domain-containing protein [Anaerolineales bacterium]|nr:GAF domain-containing protein [Anaerolineales bacterium]
MWNSLRRFLAPPTFEGDEDKTRSALYIHWFTLAIMVVTPFLVILTRLRLVTATTGDSFNITLLILFLLNAFVWGVSKSGRVAAAGYLLIAATWLAANVTAYSGSGVSDSAFTANFVIITAVTLLLGWRQAIGVSALTILAGFGITYAKAASIAGASFSEAASLSVLLGLFAALLFVFTNGLSSALSESRASAKKLEESNRSVSAVRLRLEENQDALQAANEQLQRRAERIDAVANISRTITLTQETERILPLIATAIGSRLGYSHVGVYLLDENGQNVLLSAASSEEGLQLMHNKSRVSVAPDNIIGFVVSRGAARAIQTEAERISLDSPDSLPNSRSRLVLPLKVQERAIGALDIQSERAEDFAREDFSTLQVLADQAAIAIQNARAVEQLQDALQKAEIVSSQLTNQVWRESEESRKRKGYRYDGVKPEPIYKKTQFPAAERPLSIPVVLRGQTIGNLKLNPTDASRRWTEDEIVIAKATAERVAIALEGARLLDDAQKRAQHETFLSEVSAKLGASFQMDSILRDTVEELGRFFHDTTVAFRLINPSANAASDHAHREDGS